MTIGARGLLTALVLVAAGSLAGCETAEGPADRQGDGRGNLGVWEDNYGGGRVYPPRGA